VLNPKEEVKKWTLPEEDKIFQKHVLIEDINSFDMPD